jgi:predicted nucleotidyltransferase
MTVKSFGLAQETLDKLNSVFEKFHKISQVLLYGSRAKGNFRHGSDIDLCLVGEGLSTTDLLKIENEIDELMLPYKVDLSILAQIEGVDLIEHIERVGKVFFVRP